MWETRIYLVYKSPTVDRPYNMLFEHFVRQAETEGTVYSVPSFLTALTRNKINMLNYYARAGLVKDGQIIKELRY